MALPKTPPIEISNVSETRRQFSETLDRVRRHEARVVIEKSGIPIAAIISMEDLASLRLVEDKREESRRKLIEFLGQTRSGFDDLSEDELEREIELARAEIKREHDNDLA